MLYIPELTRDEMVAAVERTLTTDLEDINHQYEVDKALAHVGIKPGNRDDAYLYQQRMVDCRQRCMDGHYDAHVNAADRAVSIDAIVEARMKRQWQMEVERKQRQYEARMAEMRRAQEADHD